jgi:hypothetical protein
VIISISISISMSGSSFGGMLALTRRDAGTVHYFSDSSEDDADAADDDASAEEDEAGAASLIAAVEIEGKAAAGPPPETAAAARHGQAVAAAAVTSSAVAVLPETSPSAASAAASAAGAAAALPVQSVPLPSQPPAPSAPPAPAVQAAPCSYTPSARMCSSIVMKVHPISEPQIPCHIYFDALLRGRCCGCSEALSRAVIGRSRSMMYARHSAAPFLPFSILSSNILRRRCTRWTLRRSKRGTW